MTSNQQLLLSFVFSCTSQTSLTQSTGGSRSQTPIPLEDHSSQDDQRPAAAAAASSDTSSADNRQAVGGADDRPSTSESSNLDRPEAHGEQPSYLLSSALLFIESYLWFCSTAFTQLTWFKILYHCLSLLLFVPLSFWKVGRKVRQLTLSSDNNIYLITDFERSLGRMYSSSHKRLLSVSLDVRYVRCSWGHDGEWLMSGNTGNA